MEDEPRKKQNCGIEIDKLNLHTSTFCLLQPPLVMWKTKKAATHKVRWGDRLLGLCCDGNKLYCVESKWSYDRPGDTASLCLYAIGTNQASPKLLDTMALCRDSLLNCRPRVDSETHRVYVPCKEGRLLVFQSEGNRLVKVKELGCIRDAYSVAVFSSDTVFVCDSVNKSVWQVNVELDRVMKELPTPRALSAKTPRRVSVLGDTALVSYGNNTLVAYTCSSEGIICSAVVQPPEGLLKVWSIATFRDSGFLLIDRDSVFLLDEKFLCHKFPAGYGGRLLDGTVVNQNELWLGSQNGDIEVVTFP